MTAQTAPAAVPEAYSFVELLSRNPCNGCPAPCCRMTTTPYSTPTTYRDIDHLLYLLRFDRCETVWASEGAWSLVHWSVCAELDTGSCRCKLHGSLAKPLVCREYDPISCWYKRVFIGRGDPEILRINLARMEILVDTIAFDDRGLIVRMPDFKEACALVHEIDLYHTFEMSLSLVKDDQQNLQV